jgi:hypothetical protein
MHDRTIARRSIETRQALLAPTPSTRRSPGLRVFLTVGIAPVPASRAHVALVRFAGGVAPVRVSVYVNGELIECWMPSPERCELLLPVLLPGRHAITVRAIDARGRWGGASAIVQVPG